MNYTELINRFWRLDEERRFTTAETRMYLQLLNIFNRVGFDRSISLCNALAVGQFGISLHSYRTALQALIDRGLIHVEYRTEHRRRCAVITLTSPTETTQPTTRPTTRPNVGLHPDAAEPRPHTITGNTNGPTPHPTRLTKRQRKRQHILATTLRGS